MPAHATVSCRRVAVPPPEAARAPRAAPRALRRTARSRPVRRRAPSGARHARLRPAFAEQPQGRGEPARRASPARAAPPPSPASRRSATAARRRAARNARRDARAPPPGRRARPAPRAQRSCAPSRQPPGALSYTALPHERVPEAEAARHVGRAHEVAAQQLVERVIAAGSAHAGRGRSELGLERVARDRGAPQHAAGAVGQQRRAPRPGRRRPPAGPRRPPARRRRAPRPGRSRDPRARELLEVERVAARLLVERVGRAFVDVGAEQLVGPRRAERAELEPRRAARRDRARSRAAARRLRRLPRAHAIAISTGARRRAAQERRRAARPTPESAQCRSSRISTSGLREASVSSSSRTARCVR